MVSREGGKACADRVGYKIRIFFENVWQLKGLRAQNSDVWQLKDLQEVGEDKREDVWVFVFVRLDRLGETGLANRK